MTKENDCPNTVAEKVRQAGLLIETMLGTDYLQKQCETIKKQDPDGIGVGRSHMSLTGRPLALIWLKAQEELIMGELTDVYKRQILGRTFLKTGWYHFLHHNQI